MPWEHPPTERDAHPLKLKREYCVYCKSRLETIALNQPSLGEWWNNVRFCATCGWWWLDRGINLGGHWLFEGTHATLKELDLSDIHAPIGEVRRYLLAKYEARHDLDWRLFEDVVASVFRDQGYDAVVTARQGDGGLDVILTGPDDRLIGVQVKKYRNSVMVDQIREFVGALVLKGLTHGIFVTTSGFTRGAHNAALDAHHVGTPVELVDATRFFDALRISTRAETPDPEEWSAKLADVSCIPYDTAGFLDSAGKRTELMHRYYAERGEPVPEAPSLETDGAAPVLKHREYTGTYRFEDSVRLYIGAAEHSSGDWLSFDFEVVDEAEEVFRRVVDDHIEWRELFPEDESDDEEIGDPE